MFFNKIFHDYSPKKKVFLHKSVPYFSQWESKKLVNSIIHKKIPRKRIHYGKSQDPKQKMTTSCGVGMDAEWLVLK